ncbi:hypothetical protein L3X38_041598 [Prunus dulcis]|uniref:Uncharacterized protein n=1 Tax=Prunus dulcis TaxID=3755 RepID=A0AAD4UT95_PRUDU|nr:hypothetical protein L3X38_041598 [Prunus dulcis]
MMTCIILHNMIVEDKYDYDALEVYEPDPMNMALTRIYERPMGPSGEPFEPEPLCYDPYPNDSPRRRVRPKRRRTALFPSKKRGERKCCFHL